MNGAVVIYWSVLAAQGGVVLDRKEGNAMCLTSYRENALTGIVQEARDPEHYGRLLSIALREKAVMKRIYPDADISLIFDGRQC